MLQSLKKMFLDCPHGYYGVGCRGICSGHCMREEPCDHVSGECSNGCLDGFTGERCNICKILT